MEKRSKSDLKDAMIFIDPGLCPKCFIPLYIIEGESQTVQINKEGKPIDILDTLCTCTGYCSECGYTSKMLLKQDGSYAPYSRTLELLQQYQEKMFSEERIKRIHDLANDNPLAMFKK